MGVLVAAGMMGGLALYLATVTKQQHVTQKKAETGTEITALHHRILSVFHDPMACTETLGKGGDLSNGDTLLELKNKAGTVIIEANPGPNPDPNKDIGRMLRVEEILLDNVPASGQTREIEVRVTIKKLSRAITGEDTVIKTIPLTVQMDANDKIASCHTKLDAIAVAIKKEFCDDIGADWDASTGKCSLQQILNSIYNSITNLQQQVQYEYVKKSGDTMTGPLEVPAITAEEIAVDRSVSAADVIASGKVSAADVTASGTVSAADVTASGTVKAGGPTPTPISTPTPTSCGPNQVGQPPNCVNKPDCNNSSGLYSTKEELERYIERTNRMLLGSFCGKTFLVNHPIYCSRYPNALRCSSACNYSYNTVSGMLQQDYGFRNGNCVVIRHGGYNPSPNLRKGTDGCWHLGPPRYGIHTCP